MENRFVRISLVCTIICFLITSMVPSIDIEAKNFVTNLNTDLKINDFSNIKYNNLVFFKLYQINILKILIGANPFNEWSETEIVSWESEIGSAYQSLFIDSDGTIHVAWEDYANYGGSGWDDDIFYKYKQSGGDWSTTYVISTESEIDSNLPSIGVDYEGTVHIAWQDKTDYNSSGGDWDIFYKYKPDGGSWQTTEVISTESTSDSECPTLIIDSNDNVHVAWHDITNYQGCGGLSTDIFYKYKINGGNWSVTEVVSTESNEHAKYPDINVDDTDNLHIAWADLSWFESGINWEDVYKNNMNGDWDIIYKNKTNGGDWSSPEVVSTGSDDISMYPSLAIDSSDTVHVAWRDYDDYGGSGSDWDILYSYKLDGDSWETNEVVSTESTNRSEGPSLDVQSDGTVHVAWHDLTDYSGSGTDDDVFYKYKISGEDWSSTEVVSTESDDWSWFCSLDVVSDGTVHIAWFDPSVYGGSGSDMDIFYKYREGMIINEPPLISNPDPEDGGTDISITIENLSVYIADPEGDSFDWSIETSPFIGENSGTGNNDTMTCSVEGLDYDTTYTWYVNATDTEGSGQTTEEVYTFETESYENDPPVFSNPDPPDGENNVPVTISLLSIYIDDPEDDSFDWSITTDPDIGSNSDSNDNDGEKECPVGNLQFSTTYTWTVIATDSYGETNKENFTFTTNSPPDRPERPRGPSKVKKGVEYEWCCIASDPDNDSIYYWFDWYDGDSGWLGPYNSGEECCATHIYDEEGSYAILVQVRDVHEAISEWSEPLEVEVPRNRGTINSFIFNLFERYLNLFLLFRHILGYQ